MVTTYDILCDVGRWLTRMAIDRGVDSRRKVLAVDFEFGLQLDVCSASRRDLVRRLA